MRQIFSLICFFLFVLKGYSSIIYVNVNASGTNNGNSWTNAYTDLQTALSSAFVNDDIWVATGTYKPTQTSTRTISFVMKNGVDIFGGFNGTETSITERDIVANPTYLSGDIGAQGDNTDNTYKVVKIQNFTTPFTFDGFRVVSGYDETSSGKGAGIYVFNNPGIAINIKNTILYNNYAYHSGGGMLIDNSNTIFNNCEFLYNSSYNYGGGAIYSANVSQANIYLYDCSIIGNNSRQGAAINFDGGELVMERNFVSSNTSTTSGNIINVSQGVTRFEINNSLIVGNQVSNGGSSIISSYTSDANSSSLTNVTICHNKNSSAFDVYSEAIYQSNSAMVISNCIVFGNTNSDLNVQIDAGNIVRNSIVENGYSTGININTTDPLFVNPGSLSIAPFDGLVYDYSLQNASPAVNYGNNLYAQTFTLDLLNNARVQQLIVDCGAIESPYTDTQEPIALCSDVTLPLTTTGEAILSAAQINNNSTDNIGITSYTLSQTDFNCSDIGSNFVQLTVSDVAGNASNCNANVLIVDLLSPTIITQNISVYLDENGQVAISASEIDNGTFDNCELDTIFISQTEFSCVNSGTNVITFSAIDVNGNTHSSNAIVTVIDSLFPIALAQNKNLYLNANGIAQLTASEINNGSFDDCSIALMTISQTTFSCADLGPNQVTFGVKDPFGNLSSTVVTVTVLDTIKPITNGQSITLNLNVTNPAVVIASQVNAGSSDNCTFSQTVSPSSYNATGVYSVLLTSTDVSGNSSSGLYTVTVIDEPFVGLEEQESIQFSVSPNPSEGLIHVKTGLIENQIDLRLLDISGKLIAKKSYFNQNEFEYIVEGAAGIYYLEIETSTFKSKCIKVMKF
jgi:predicted outer membrane repeat protein